MKNIYTIVLCILLMFTTSVYSQQKKIRSSNVVDWTVTVDPYKPGQFTNPKKLPLISVKGNSFVLPTGDTIIFRGLAVADPDKLDQDGQWNKQLFEFVKSCGANIVRIPVHPIAWRVRTPEKYLNLLHQAVEWCTELELYVIIDWHSIGNLGMELFQDPMYNTTKKETYEFWRIIAIYFQGNNTVAFYELFNEPTTYSGKLGRMSWSEWKQINENIISLIRAYDEEPIPLVAGFDWGYDLTPLRIEPVQANGIAYVTHPYPHKRTPPYEPKWDEVFGFAREKYPIFATEFGLISGDHGYSDNEDYANRIIAYFDSLHISWTAWILDPDWYPRLLDSWKTMKLTSSGVFFKKVLLERNTQREQ